MTSIRQRT